MSTPKLSRTRKGSVKDLQGSKDNTSTSDDFASHLTALEERLKSFFREEIKSIHDRLASIEGSVSSLKSETVRLDNEITQMRDIVLNQQLRIEKHEEFVRAKNLIVHNIPEKEVNTSLLKLKNDVDKVAFLCDTVRIEIDTIDIEATQRLGRRNSDKPRPLKVSLRDKGKKFEMLNKRRNISSSDILVRTFGEKIFVNPDNSFLVQKEEARLRSELKKLKAQYPHASLYIRSGSLYLDGEIVDKVNIKKQLFD